MSKKNILQEAIADAKELKAAALSNAENVLLEHLKDNLKSVVEAHLNENEEGEKEEGGDMKLETALEENEQLMAGEEEMEEEDEAGDEGDEDEGDEDGLSEEDLEEALGAALSLQEVEQGALGEPEEIDPDTHDTGLLDVDTKPAGWQEKEAPAATDRTVKENRALKSKVIKLVTENALLKKANSKISSALNEVKLFNAKLFYANKLMQKEGLGIDTKKKIVQKMDSVKSLSEAKNLYESLDMALGLMTENAKSSKKGSTRSLAESVVSTSQKGISEVRAPHLTENVTASVNRMRYLAGLVKED